LLTDNGKRIIQQTFRVVNVVSLYKGFLNARDITRFYTVSVTIVYVCTYRCPKNGALRVHYGVEETTVNVRKMLKKFYWTYLLIWGSLKVALNRSIISKYMSKLS
jgi:hypothetical protein